MKKLITIILVISIAFCYIGCNEKNTKKQNANDNESTSKSEIIDNSIDYADNNVIKENIKINSLDKLNFYAVKQALAQNNVETLSTTSKNINASPIKSSINNNSSKLINLSKTSIDKNSTFTITMYSYFTVTLSDTNGFLASKLGGTGSVEVVITRNNFNNMITFKKGDRYFSCLETSSNNDKSITFSSNKYVQGYQLVESSTKENYDFTVYFESDRVVSVKCTAQNGYNIKYSADRLSLNNNFSFVIHKKQSISISQLEKVFSKNNLFVDDGIVLDNGTIIFASATATNNSLSIVNSNYPTITKNDILNVSALFDRRYGYCIKLEMTSDDIFTEKITSSLLLDNIFDREVTLRPIGSFIYIIDLNSKNRMSDIYYKFTVVNKIGDIISYDDFTNEMSKSIDLNNYIISEKYYEKYYELKYEKSVSFKDTNYEITVDDITFSLPIKVSDLLAKGFTVYNDDPWFTDSILQGAPTFVSPKGNTVHSFVMDFYGTSTNFYDCYVTQVEFICNLPINNNQNELYISPCEFDIMEGINSSSTIDNVISRLGEPNEMRIHAIDNSAPFIDWCTIQLAYDIYSTSLPNGRIWFTFTSYANRVTPTEKLETVSFSLQ